MDQYANYRFCDSLDYLIPPVNKNRQNLVTQREVFRNLLEINGSYMSKHSTYIKRTSEEKIRSKLTNVYDRRTLQTIFPYDNKRSRKTYKNDKPVIKITISPKSTETQTSKVFNKRIFKNNIKSTRSNHEGRRLKVHSVSGKKREKIHEIRTSESEDFLNKRKIFPNLDLQFGEEVNNYSNGMDTNNSKDKRKKHRAKDMKGCDVKQHKSRVTIVGRLGLTEDDKYILNCAATINDKPIHTNITQDVPVMTSTRERPMESQGIQVNMLNDPDFKNRQVAMYNKYSQCACTNNLDNKIEHENTTIKGYQSPVVVISVYPNQESHIEGPIIKVEERQVPSKTKPEVEQNVTTKEKLLPKELLSKKKNNLRSDNNQLSGNTSASPNRFHNFTRKQYTLLGSSKTDVAKTKSNVRCDSKVKTPKKVSQGNKSNRDIQNIDASRSLAKKALVDNYINRLEIEEAKDNIKPTRRNNPSKVTINIDGESERYDLLFKHDLRNTDFSVRKTLKSNKKKDMSSMENLLIMPKDSKLISSSSLSHNSPLKSGITRSPSPERDQKTLNKTSTLNVRDSIEVFHGRTSAGGLKEKKAGKNNICYRMKNDISSNDKGRAKHYRGDPCSVPDPSERDKEIRQLLGILTGRNFKSQPKQNSKLSQESFFVKNGEGCAEPECKKKRLKMSSSLAKLFSKGLLTKQKKMEEKSNTNIKYYVHCREIENEKHRRIPVEESKEKCVLPNDGNNWDIIRTNYNILQNKTSQNDYDNSFILNRNIYVYLDGEQFKRQKPMLLTRKQYNKVKRRIQNRVCKKISNERRKAIYYSNVSIGDVREISKLKHEFRPSKEVQTDHVEIKKESDIQIKTTDSSELTTDVLFRRNMIDEENNYLDDENCHSSIPRKVASSMEVRYASVSFMKQVTYSSPTCNKDSSYAEQRDDNSIHTIFKGHKRSVTPNLGTSAYSLSSGLTKESDSSKRSKLMASKKKPLIQRLVSCLIMRSKISDIKIGKPKKKNPTRFSSINSYNISTSFAGVAIPSSLYDTSVSFYSNHTIMPVKKMKRSFFSSVKGFLTNHRNNK